ncbi:MAG: GAF domain-containing protein, partial [Polyangiaceae bacterium]
HSPHGIIVSDVRGGFVLQNRAAERIWAGSATIDSVDGWGVYRAFHPDGRPYGPGDWSMARCLTNREVVEAEEVHFQRFDGTHGILLGSCAPIVNKRGEIEGALGVFADITELKHVEERLHIITDSVPALIAYIDPQLRYRFVNLSYERWFGLPRADIEGRPLRAVLGDAAFELLRPHLQRALDGDTGHYTAPLPYRLGGVRHVDATYVPHLGPDRSVLGLVALVTDITDQKRMEQERARWSERTEQLLRITAALADAVTPDEVLEAVVDRAGESLQTRAAALWLVDEDGRTANVVRSSSAAGERIDVDSIRLDGSGSTPVARALATGMPVWAPALLSTGPRSTSQVRAIAALPLAVEDRRIGALAFSFAGPSTFIEDDRSTLVVVARHSAQALERARLLREAELAYQETSLLYRLTDAVNRASSVQAVYDASLDAIQGSLGAPRASIVFFDPEGDPRVEASRGLSAEYIAAVTSGAPWSLGERDPEPVFINDAASSPRVSPYADLVAREPIAALASVPLTYEGHLLGKLTLYWSEARTLSDRGRSVARSIADQIAAGAGKKLAQAEKERLIQELSQTVRLNELFAAVVGHDLRNPLAAIMSTAQVALRRDEGDRLRRPLTRVVSAGERMTRMIEQLLDFTRARSGTRFPVDPQDMDLAELCRRVLGEIEDAHPGRAIAFEIAGDARGVWDPDRLAQVVSNLAGNAIHHSAPASVPRVLLDGTDHDDVVLRITNDRAIVPEILPVLFEPFRTATRRRAGSRGLGLGLDLTQQIVLAHRGAITAEPDAARDTTTFVVRLPRRLDPRAG